MYNETLSFIEELEKNTPNDIVVLRPEYSINSFESDVKKLEDAYKHGYDIAVKNIENISKLLQE